MLHNWIPTVKAHHLFAPKPFIIRVAPKVLQNLWLGETGPACPGEKNVYFLLN